MLHSDEDEPSEFDSYLADMRDDGTLDSAGNFTIDVRSAQRKLAAFSLSAPENWLLLMVQAAHRGDAESISVVQFPAQTSLTVSGRWTWTFQDLMTVLEGEVTTQSDVYSFAAAVRALTGNPTVQEFLIKAPDGTVGRWRDERFVVLSPSLEDFATRGSVVVDLIYRGRLNDSNPFLEPRPVAPEEIAAIERLLVTDCSVSSVPLQLNGARLTALTSSEGRVLLAALPLDAVQVPAIRLTLWESSHSAAVLLTLNFELTKRKLTLKTPESSICWIQDGVVVDRDKLLLEGPLEVTVLASAAGLKTDISGLVLIRDEQMEARTQAIEKGVSSSLVDLQEALSEAPLEKHLGSVKLKQTRRWFFWRPRDAALTPEQIRQTSSDVRKQAQDLPPNFARRTSAGAAGYVP